MAEQTEPNLATNIRQLERQRTLLTMMGDLLVPVTEGFKHINLDVAFTFLDKYDLQNVRMLNNKIVLAYIAGLRQSQFILESQFSIIVNSSKSRNAKSMNLFTNVTTKVEQQFEDRTPEKKGFSWFGFNKKKKEGE